MLLLYTKILMNTLKECYNQIEKDFKRVFHFSVKIGHFFEGPEEIKDPKNLDANQNHIMISMMS